MKPKVPPKPKPQSSVDERKILERNLQRYHCLLPKDLSQRTRTQGLQEGKTMCSVVYIAVEEYTRAR